MTDLTHLLPEHPDDYIASVRHEIRLRRAGFDPYPESYKVIFNTPNQHDPFCALSLLDLYKLLPLEPDNPVTLLSEGPAITRTSHTNFAEPDPIDTAENDWNPFMLGGAFFAGGAYI